MEETETVHPIVIDMLVGDLNTNLKKVKLKKFKMKLAEQNAKYIHNDPKVGP